MMGVRGWTMAGIRQESLERGGHFFSPQTMRAFGDTMASFRIVRGGQPDSAGMVHFRRVRPMHAKDGRAMGGVGKLYEFNPETGTVRSAGP